MIQSRPAPLGLPAQAASIGLLPALPLLSLEAPHLLQGLISLRAAPVLIVGTIAALRSGWKLRRRRFRLARLSTMVRMTGLLADWGMAPYPCLIYPDRTTEAGATPDATRRFVLWLLPPGMALLLPSLWLLFRVFKPSEHQAPQTLKGGMTWSGWASRSLSSPVPFC